MAKNFKELLDNKEFKWGGFNPGLFFSLMAVALVVVYMPFNGKEAGVFFRPTFLTILSVLAIFGIFFGEIGERIPFWNDYIGGGTVLVFLVAAIMGTYKLVPEPMLKTIGTFYDGANVNFLEMFIPVLIVGSILTVNRKSLIQSIAGYIPLIIIGVIGATIGGVVVGLLFGKAPFEVMMNYVLPIMGGGTGAGAIPMSEMWATKTGRDAKEWFAFAISILTIANVIAILCGAVLKNVGIKYPSLTGNGELVISTEKQNEEKEEKVEAGLKEVAAGLFFIGMLALISEILTKVWGSLGMSFEIHRLAWLVLLAIFLNVLNVVPKEIKAGAKKLQGFFSKHTIWVLMAAVGFDTDVNEIINAFTFANVAIALAIVLGAVGMIMLVARKMKFYPVEAAITAGLCMANRGGSGDIAVLGAADRMELMSYAQISSRIGGAMMLILASVIFGLLA